MTAPTDAERARSLYRSCIVTAHIHNAVGAVDPDTCSTCGGNFREHLAMKETRMTRFIAEVSAALAAVRAQEQERCARIAEEWGAGDSRAQANSVTCRKIADAIRRREG